MAKYSGRKFQEHLLQLMDEASISMTELHKNTGIPITTIQRLRTDDEANPTITSLKPIADFFNISIDQLIGNEKLPETTHKREYIENKNFWTKIPVITWRQAIAWPDKTKKFEESHVLSDISLSRNSYALRIENDLEDGFRKNAIIIIDPNLKPENMDYVVTHKTGSTEAALKQIKHYDGEVYLKPLQKDFATTQLNNEYTILGIVRQIKLDLTGRNT